MLKTNIQSQQRFLWVDWMKGVGILMVVFGHTKVLRETEVTRFFYSFDIPLFFIISGVLQKPLGEETSFLDFLKSKIRRLVIPYFAWSAISFCIWFLIRSHGQEGVYTMSVADCALSYLQGQPAYNPALWFFLCLFMAALIAFPFFQTKVKARGIVISLALVTVLTWATCKGYSTFWSIQSACVAVPFLILGHRFRYLVEKVAASKRILLVLFFPTLLFLLLACFLNSRVSMKAADYGNIIFFYVSSFSGFLWILSCSLCSKLSGPIIMVGRLSAVIFAAHLAVSPIISFPFRRIFHLPMQGVVEGPMWIWFVYMFVLVFSIVVGNNCFLWMSSRLIPYFRRS